MCTRGGGRTFVHVRGRGFRFRQRNKGAGQADGRFFRPLFILDSVAETEIDAGCSLMEICDRNSSTSTDGCYYF